MNTAPAAASGGARQGVLVIVASVALLSSGSTVVKWSGEVGSVIAAWRLLGAAIAWWLLLVVRRRLRGTPLPSAAAWRAAAPAGLFFGVDLALFFTAVSHTSVGHAEFIGSLTPLLLVPLGMVVFGERPHLWSLPAGLVALVGLAVFLLNGPSGGPSSVRGDLIAVAALFSWVAYLAFGRSARATVGVSDFMAIVMPIGLLVAAPVAIVAASGRVWSLEPRGWAAVLMLTVITGVVGHALIAVAQRLLDVGTISVVQVLQPVAAVLWAWAVLGERIAVGQLPGMALIVGGLVAFVTINLRRDATRRAAAAPPATVPIGTDAAAELGDV